MKWQYPEKMQEMFGENNISFFILAVLEDKSGETIVKECKVYYEKGEIRLEKDFNDYKLQKWMEMPDKDLPTSSLNQDKEKLITRDFILSLARTVNDYNKIKMMGINNIVLDDFNNKIIIYLNRPGLLIGKGGELISAVEEEMKKEYPELELKIIETNFANSIDGLLRLYFFN